MKRSWLSADLGRLPKVDSCQRNSNLGSAKWNQDLYRIYLHPIKHEIYVRNNINWKLLILNFEFLEDLTFPPHMIATHDLPRDLLSHSTQHILGSLSFTRAL